MIGGKKAPASYTVGLVLLFIPSFLGLLVIFDLLPDAGWAQIATSVAIVGCVGVGSYLAWWGKRPRRARNEWTPSKTLPRDDAQ